MTLKTFFSDLRRRWREGARLRIMVYALLASVVCGVTGFLEPVDDGIRNLRYLARDVSADGSIVVVGIDQESLDAVGERWPWTRNHFATLVDRLKKAGAGKIVFDKALADADSHENDRVFTDVVKKYRGDIFLGAGFGQSENGRVNGILLPAAGIRSAARIASFKVRYNAFGQTDEVYMEAVSQDVHYPSISTIVSGQKVISGRRIRPDFSIKAKSFPYIRAGDIIARKPIKPLNGANVLIGDAARSLGDTRFLPAQGALPGVYIHAIAAQTLKSGIPSDAGWFAPLCIAFIVGVTILFSNSRRLQFALNLAAFVAISIAPIALDASHVSVELAPALLLMVIVLVQHARLRLGWHKSRVNETSGLANVFALRELESRSGTAVIAAKIDNYSAIVASFPRNVEGSIVAEIVGRLRLRDDDLQIYQADDGIFYWISSIARPVDLGNHLEGLKALFASAMQIGERRVDVAVSFGADLDASRSIASRAGSALLCAEEAFRTGKRWKLYDPTRTVDAAWQLSLASEIDHAMEAEEFWLAYQPKLNLRTGRITGGEILLRWRHPERGEISPAEFIPAAERSQRIGRLTDYVVQRALASAQLLAADGDCNLAVNVSVPVLGNPDFAQSLLMKCEGAGVRPQRIMIEITESVLMTADDAQVEATLAQLRNCGFGLSIDDFGTGFSSLEYVRRIPAHEMKIDQSFVRRVLNSPADRVVVESVLRMAHELGRNVVAEGVEDEATLGLLRELGCDEVQGYHIGRPVDFATFRSNLSSGRDRAAA